MATAQEIDDWTAAREMFTGKGSVHTLEAFEVLRMRVADRLQTFKGEELTTLLRAQLFEQVAIVIRERMVQEPPPHVECDLEKVAAALRHMVLENWVVAEQSGSWFVMPGWY